MPGHGDGEWISGKASGAIAAYRIVKGTTTDGVLAQASTSKDKFVGVTGAVGAADAATFDRRYAGAVPVEFGGAAAFGDPLTSDSLGRAIAAKAGDSVIGYAGENVAALGIIGEVFLSITTGKTIKLGTLPAFAAGDCVPTTLEHDTLYPLPATAANSTFTAPTGAVDGTRCWVQANGVLNGHTVTYRDGSGNVVLTAALTASKRHKVELTMSEGKWMATVGLQP